MAQWVSIAAAVLNFWEIAHTLPPRTSSPMMRHAALCIVRVLLSCGVAILNIVNGRASGLDGLQRCRAICDTRDNIERGFLFGRTAL